MKGILEKQQDIKIAGVFSSTEDLCARTVYHEDETIIFADPVFDLTAPTLSKLHMQFPSIKTMLIAPIKSMRSRLEDLAQGIRGILAAESVASCFPDAIRTVNSGKAYVSVELLSLFSQHFHLKSFAEGYESLSERELEIFTRIAAGKRNHIIGSELDISSKTVSSHKMRLMDKLGVNSVPELVQYAMQTGLIDIAAQRLSK